MFQNLNWSFVFLACSISFCQLGNVASVVYFPNGYMGTCDTSKADVHESITDMSHNVSHSVSHNVSCIAETCQSC